MASEQKSIIVVEDDQDAAEIFGEMMRINGFHVLKASGSGPAISIIQAEQPAAVILDIMMPDISGLEVLRYIHGNPNLAMIPVIVITAKNLPIDIKTGLEAGASIYLTKPVGYLDLKQAIEKVLGT